MMKKFYSQLSFVTPLRGMIFVVFLLAGLIGLPGTQTPVWAQEVISVEEPAPSSAEKVTTPMERSFTEKPPEPVLFPGLKEKLKDTPAFFRDTKLNLNIRTYYFYRDKFDDSKSEAWALGGGLTYQSGLLADRFGMGAAVYTSQPLYAPDNRDGTLLLKPGQEGYTVLGQLYGKAILFKDNFISIYRQTYNTPYINMNDNRMTPNTFEGYTFQGAYGGKDGAPGFRYGGGYIDKIKERNSDEFVSMSRDAGADVKRGVAVAGGNVTHKDISFGAIDYYSDDIINIFYTEGSYKLKMRDQLGLLFAGQYSDQRSVGDDLLKGYSFSGRQFGLKGDVSLGGGILTLAYTNTGEGADMQSPWSGYPGYTSVQVQDFNRAGEDAFMIKGSYDFSRLGLQGVSAYALMVHGWGAIDPATNYSVYNQNEYDLDLQWRPKIDFLKGVWFRGRYARVDQQGNTPSINDFRIIVNYDIPLL